MNANTKLIYCVDLARVGWNPRHPNSRFLRRAHCVDSAARATIPSRQTVDSARCSVCGFHPTQNRDSDGMDSSSQGRHLGAKLRVVEPIS